ncbi:hypothetical protein D0Z07_6401 [Hyphodiscus hymeniophilus]|uniref:Uncharacterized protein n=1 Tax=Hyphodiscus hymeniophilus TaxID=353542 RepID=A0A9P7AUH6_9HELO|nr:hypothetical protein D0Z07_6401 [Hyphodiscus hymeniophilus]
MSALEDMMVEEVHSFVQAISQQTTFAFGDNIGAITAWRQGEALDMITENDAKSRMLALFSTFPVLQSAWSVFESMIYTLTRWRSQSTSIVEKFDNVSLKIPFSS